MKCFSTRLACSQGRSSLARASSTVAVHRATKISSRARAKTVAASCSDNRVVIELPDGMHPAAVIGRKAENLKLLQRRSGAHIQVPKKTATDNLNTVTITGTQQAIQAARDLLEAQIQAYIAQGGAYPHPLKALYLLHPAFGNSSQQLVKFAVKQDAISSYTGVSEQLYVLEPASVNGDASLQTVTDNPVEDSHSALDLSALKTAALLHKDHQAAVQELLNAVREAITHCPTFDEIELAFNLGKHFFYRGHLDNTSWTVQQLQGKEVPDDLKSVYSNAVLPETCSAITTWLEQHGFTQMAEKEMVSVHAIHRGLSAGFTLWFDKHSDGSVTLQKIKTKNNRLMFMTFLSQANQPDWRARLIAHYHPKPDSPMAIATTLADLAQQAQLLPGPKLQLPALDSLDTYVDKERHQRKVMYQGEYSCQLSSAAASTHQEHDATSSDAASPGLVATQINLTLVEVTTAADGAAAREVEVCSPQLNDLLQAALQTGSLTEHQEQQLMAHVRNIMGFAEQLVQIIAQ